MITYGFYNSVEGDRKYDAIQMSSIFDGIIEDGVFMSIGDAFKVTANGDGMNISVGTGRAWFNHTWTLVDADYPLVVDTADSILDRIDAVVLDIDASTSKRENSITIVVGTPASTPNPPSMIKETDHNQYPLCHIRVKHGTTAITQSNITNMVGTSACPYVTGPLETIKTDDLITEWESQWADKLTEWGSQWDNWFSSEQLNMTNEFTNWFNSLQVTLDDNTAANLANQIQTLSDRTTHLESLDNAVSHNTIYRGKNLGSIITAEQYSAIGAGTFEDMYIGDYWEINGSIFYIADFDYWYGIEQGENGYLNKHHVVIVYDPESYGFFSGSALYINHSIKTESIDTVIKNNLVSIFSDKLLDRKDWFVTNMSSDGTPTEEELRETCIDLLSESMLTGSYTLSKVKSNLNWGQLNLFKLNRSFIASRDHFWLRDTISNNVRVACSYNHIQKSAGGYSNDVLVCFGITGTTE